MKKTKEKLCFIGEGHTGGALRHLLDLTELLKNDYEIEVVFSKLPNKQEMSSNTNVILLEGRTLGESPFLKFPTDVRIILIAKFLFAKMKILKHFNFVFDNIKQITQKDQDTFEKRYGYSEHIIEHVLKHQHTYKGIIMIGLDNMTNIRIIQNIPNKSFLIPIAHETYSLAHPVFRSIINKPAFIAFNTIAEVRYTMNYMGPISTQMDIVGIGVNTFISTNTINSLKIKYNISEKYVVYIGRIDNLKIGNLIKYFVKYKQKHVDEIKLVLIGNKSINIPNREDIICTGFVSEEEKYCLLENSLFLINPSTVESLSIVVLEAMAFKKPILTNGKCSVLKDHCKLSNGGYSYTNYIQFEKCFSALIANSYLRKKMGECGYLYVEKNYNWGIIKNKITSAINKFL